MSDLLPGNDPARKTDAPDTPKMTDEEIVRILEGYRTEAQDARKTGPNARDEKWAENLDLYWNRFDFSKKAVWQAKEVMPEVPGHVDRFAAALKEAIHSSPTGFYTVEDDTDREGDLAIAIKRAVDVWLTRCGTNRLGQVIGFGGVFEEQMKLGALMATSSIVTWKPDPEKGRVSIETVDPRSVWLDPTMRGLYRMRRVEMDRHDLVALGQMKGKGGKPVYNLTEIKNLVDHMSAEIIAEREALTGTGGQVSSVRKPVLLDEYLATILNPDGTIAAKKALCIVANEKFLIRGPEKNPFTHGKDWLTFAPLITAPLSVYGRTYMEDFGSLAKAFNRLTNLILDAVYVSSMKAFAMAPGMLMNPGQVAQGIHPMKIFELEDGVRPQDFFKEMDLGTLPPESLVVWKEMKNELREAAGQSEITSAQFAPKGRTSAEEIREVKQSSSALVRSIASTVESWYLNPTLDLVWKTGFQHVRKDDEAIKAAMGPELFASILRRRDELIKRPITFQARGISALLARAVKLRSLLSALQVIGANDLLMKEFLKVVSLPKLVKVLLDLFDVDVRSLQATEREKLVENATQDLARAQAGAEGRTPGQSASEGAKSQVGKVAQLATAL